LGKPVVVSFCASCFHSLQEYENCFLSDEEAAEWKKSLRPLSAMLAGAKAEPTAAAPARFGYHQPCHWSVDKDLPFLKTLFGGLSRGTGLCCGMGGILKMSNPDLSMRMAKTCLQGFPDGMDMILTGCSGCTLQLGSAAPEGVKVCHWLDVVA
jgi:glycolate oxidase iron-sulfur subunit